MKNDDKNLLAPEVREAREQARQVIKHHFGTKPARIKYMSSGLSNFVFMVKHKEGDFVVRISPDPARINDFIKEQWAQGEARKVGVPTAEILEVGNQVIPRPFMVSRTVAGGEAVNHKNRPQILEAMGRFAAEINKIKTGGWGSSFDWSNNQLSRCDTWSEYVDKELLLEYRLKVLAARRMLSDKQVKLLVKIFDDAKKTPFKPVLNHGDIRLKNVIVDEAGEINAIIDWENCTSNLAPHWELSLALHDLGIDEKQIFLRGYGIKDKTLQDTMPLVKALNIINYVPEIERLHDQKDKQTLEEYRTRFSGALDFYSY